jgi:hypothetical protein
MLQGAFGAGDQLQRGLVDLMMGFLSLEGLNPNQMMRMTSDMMRQRTRSFTQGMPGAPSGEPRPGWGPIPPADASGMPEEAMGWGPMPPWG